MTAVDAGVTIAAFLLAGSVAVAVGVGATTLLGRRQLEDRLRIYDDPLDPDLPDGPAVTEVATLPSLRRFVAITGRIAERQGFLERLERDLERADLPLRPAEAIFFGTAAALIVGALALVLSGGLIAAVVAVVVSLLLLRVVVDVRIRRRVRAFESQLPDTLELLAGTLRAGHSIGQGLDSVSREVPDPMAQELRRAVNEHRLGRTLEDSLQGVADRTGSADFAWAVMAIRIQREVGGNLAELLLTVATTMVQRERLRRDVASLTAEGRMSAMVLGLMPFILGVVMYVMNPGYIAALLTPGLGYILTGGSLVGMIVGFVWMKKLIVVEV